MTTALVCPNCQKTSRTGRELRPGSQVRCAHCRTVSKCFIHGNGAVELRLGPPPLPREATEVSPALRPPPRMSEPGRRRTIFVNRRVRRPIGGYQPFEKARSYIGNLAGIALVSLGVLVAYWFFRQIDSLNEATAQAGTAQGNIWAQRDTALRKQFQARQQKALATTKARQATDGSRLVQNTSE